MEVVNGVMMSGFAMADFRTRLNGSRKAAITLPEPYEVGGCTNCNGGGTIAVSIYGDGPYPSPPTAAKVDHFDDGWYKVERYGYPCPMCNSATQDGLITALRADCGLNEEELDWRLDYIDGMDGKENALTAARNMLSMTPEPRGLLTLFGSYGVGKSGIAKALVAAFVKAGVKAKYTRAAEILNQARQAMKGDGEDAMMWELSRYRFLVVDEVDRVTDSEYAMSTIFTLLDKRYNDRNRSATLLATNKFPDTMGKEWGYLMSRMEDGQRIPIGGDSLRGATARELNI
jgi:hypothetical protein